MKHFTRFFALMLLFVLIGGPGSIAAQTATTTDDGSTEPTPVRQERIRGYRRQSSELSQKMSALPSVANQSVIIPILFGVSVGSFTPNFGDGRDGGRIHQGEDILAPKGTPIVSPTQAVVLRTEYGAREGNTIYTANPGGETFVYMHLDRFGEGVVAGTVLNAGSLIGYVGDTGNAAGGPAHLHFELHTSSGTVDPFPRLTGEFSLQDKMTFLSTILTQTSDPTSLAQFLVINFRSTFTAAMNANIVLPAQISNALLTVPVSSTPVAGRVLPAGDLEYGSAGAAVVTLQRYLIQAAVGPAATSLAGAGATGNFGAMTRAALVEFQIAKAISPATGYYGVETRTYIAAHPLGTAVAPTPLPTPAGGTTVTVLNRDLKQGSVGEDVRTLQKFLNRYGYTVSVSGAGSVGNETTYFGPATTAAVIRFQNARGIVPAVGFVGPITRASIAAL